MREDNRSEQDEAKSKLEALFGSGGTGASGPVDPFGGAPQSKEDEARAKLEALFKK